MDNALNKPLLRVLNGERLDPPPIWLMRQAGRYLPEYRATRAKAGGFLDLCFSPKLAAEVTLQPVRRFGFDAAILFSDILVVPLALGRKVEFKEGDGPRLDPMLDVAALKTLKDKPDENVFAPIYETVSNVKTQLDNKIALIGFCGAPWTVATYMIAGHGTPDQAPARLFAYQNPEAFQGLIDLLVEASIEYLVGQLRAGADAVQIFDTWAGVLGHGQFGKWCLNPTREIVEGVRKQVPDAKIIGFPRGINILATAYAELTKIDAISLDSTIERHFAHDVIQSILPVQGNVDPMALRAGGNALHMEIVEIVATLAQGPLIFNLGHGILPDTPIAHVEQLVRTVRGLNDVSLD